MSIENYADAVNCAGKVHDVMAIHAPRGFKFEVKTNHDGDSKGYSFIVEAGKSILPPIRTMRKLADLASPILVEYGFDGREITFFGSNHGAKYTASRTGTLEAPVQNFT